MLSFTYKFMNKWKTENINESVSESRGYFIEYIFSLLHNKRIVEVFLHDEKYLELEIHFFLYFSVESQKSFELNRKKREDEIISDVTKSNHIARSKNMWLVKRWSYSLLEAEIISASKTSLFVIIIGCISIRDSLEIN